MTRNTALRTTLGFAVAGCTLLASAFAQGAHAQGSTPSITAIADSAAFGVVFVSGRNFDSPDAITLKVINPSTGALLQTAATSTSAGGFSSTIAITGACGLTQVELQAVDANTNEASDPIMVSLGSPLTLARNQLQGAENDLQAALGSPPVAITASAWLAYIQQITALQAAVIADQSGVTTAQSGACR